MDLATIIKAVAVLVTAIAPIIGMFLSFRLKSRILDHQLNDNKDNSPEVYNRTESIIFRKLVVNCMLVYFIAGTLSQGIGVYDNLDGFGELFLYKDLCWFVGNLSVLFMLLHYIYSDNKN